MLKRILSTAVLYTAVFIVDVYNWFVYKQYKR